jgi:hypothetical protein
MSGIYQLGDTFFLEGAKAIAIIPQPSSLYVKPLKDPSPFKIKGAGTEYKGVAVWGANNKLPKELCDKVAANPITAVNANFNAILTFGDGVLPVKRDKDGKLQPYHEHKEINDFLLDNDINSYLHQQAYDLWLLRFAFPEIILNNEARPKVVELNHKKAVYSRLEVMDEKGLIGHHFYSAKWGETDTPDDMVATPMLSGRNPIKDLKYKLGIEQDPFKKVKVTKDRGFIIPLDIPSPDTFYYPRPPWTSVIESGWYDFSQAIPTFKRALLNNGMVIKYHVEVHPQFFPTLYRKLGVAGDKEKEMATQKEWIEQLNKFLSNPENAGKTFISDLYQSGDKMESMVSIKQIENEYTGGEYLPDLEEVTNIISYAFDVHPSIVGSSPGKNKSINGTEARELFTMKQAMMKLYRHRLLFPLNLIKAINGWPDDIFFTIPNLELTTLDKGTGAQKTVSQPAIDDL